MTTATKNDKQIATDLQIDLLTDADLVDWLNLLVYADPGAGKTFLLGTADDDPRTRPYLHIDIDGGIRTIRNKITTKTKKGIDVKRIRTLGELVKLYDALVDHLNKHGGLPYKTIGLDNCSELADLDMRKIMDDAYSKNPEKVDKDVPSQREWGKSRTHMRNIVRAFRDLPCNVIFTAHVATLQEEGQPTKYMPGFAGKLRTDIPGFVDVVGHLRPENKQGVITRYLQVQGSHRVIAKDRTSALGTVVENPTIPMMWDLIHTAGTDNSSSSANSKGE
jgi:phage nucleotide-binding protein